MQERTFAIIKPDAVQKHHTGAIIDIIEKNDFVIARMKKLHLTKKQAQAFYAIHKEKPFFNELIEFMTSGPVVVMALEKENAIVDWRNLIGNVDSRKAAPGTIRNRFGTDIGVNAVHGSDAPETAVQELAFFFDDL